MNLNELIAECDALDFSQGMSFVRAKQLLPLLVKVIKNQQRQIERAKHPLGGLAVVLNSAASALSDMDAIASYLEDIK